MVNGEDHVTASRWQDHGLVFPSQVGRPLEERIAEQIDRGIEVLTLPDACRRKPGEPLHRNAPQGPLAMKMRAQFEEEETRNKYRIRAGIVEPVFGFVKEHRRFRRFLLRGLQKVRSEWSFTCATVNLWRLFRNGYKPQVA